jgi:hypothetical protein
LASIRCKRRLCQRRHSVRLADTETERGEGKDTIRQPLDFASS